MAKKALPVVVVNVARFVGYFLAAVFAGMVGG